jgi:molybdate transport system substrate-binding protein
VAAQTRHLPLPASLHAPLAQRMVLLKNARAAAVAFHDYIAGPAARRIFAAHGFGAP